MRRRRSRKRSGELSQGEGGLFGNYMGRKEQERCQHFREQLVKDRERLADLERRGDAACSDYDLHYGYDAVFSKQLKRNHIQWDLRQLENCPESVEQITLFDMSDLNV
jgi:hypothetical protein